MSEGEQDVATGRAASSAADRSASDLTRGSGSAPADGMAGAIVLDLPGRARVAFSTREGGVSEGSYRSLNLGILTDDDPERVSENRRRLAARVGVDPGCVAMGWQVHGSDMLEWTEPPARGGYASPGAELDRVDGHATSTRGLGLLVLAADCLPVALASPERVAIVHCGWRGLAAGILERALQGFEAKPAAAIGPGIGACCYEVGPEVLSAFEGAGAAPAASVPSAARAGSAPAGARSHAARPEAAQPSVAPVGHLDLRAIARSKLHAAGVSRIEDVNLCTSCREDLFFSHRRDGAGTGRQGALAWRVA